MDARPILPALVFALSALASTRAPAQTTPPPQSESAPAFKPDKLEQLVAPIALYPDSLLTMILMASTYPLEVIEADRWIESSKVTGTALAEELKNHDWDPSVKSLCSFPSVLKRMNDNLDWTQDLGDAFLGQKADVMKTVQAMRQKALDAGTLKSSEQQKVSQDGQVVIIEPATPEVIYVPTYSPTVVYGPSWYYPTWYYPPMYAPPAPGAMLFAFSMGVAWGAGCWGGCNWHSNDVDINVNKYNSFNKNTCINAQKYNLDGAKGNQGSWSHNPEHRRGANYRDPQTAQRYAGASGSSRVTSDQARGYDRGASGGRDGSDFGDRGGSSWGGGFGDGGSSAFSGSRSPDFDRSSSTRGFESLGGSGGGSWGGAGGWGGGGGRGGFGGRRR